MRFAAICGLLLAQGSSLHAQTSVLTWHNDNARTGQNLQETILTPASIQSSTFGKLFVINVDGKVDAQPLYVPSLLLPSQSYHNMLYVVTEHDSAYAFDADNGTELWKVSLLEAGETTSEPVFGCTQVEPEIGVTATPAIDPQIGPHGTMYAVAMSKDGSGNYHQRLHALDLATGAEQLGGPIEVQATYPGSGAENTFRPMVHKSRPGLLISNGVVYTSWGSHCDGGSYAGWVIGYSEASMQRVSALNLAPNGNDNAVWASGAGPAADGSGNIFLLTGNGTFDTTLNASGFPNQGDFGNAFVKISTNGGLSVADYFTMSNTVSESNQDEDLGSGGAVLLPPLNDAQGRTRSLAVGAGKDGHIYVVDQNNLGKFNPATNAIYQDIPGAAPGGIFSSPAWFNGTLYYGDVGGSLKAFAFRNGEFQTTGVSQSSHSFGYPGATPSISANGTSNAIVWAADNTNPAELHAFDATNLASELYNSNLAAGGRDHFGTGNKFIVPTVANGKVYVGTTNGVGVFGLLCSYAIAPQSITVPAGGGSQTVNVVASMGCAWNATSNAAFLSVTSGSPGSGSGTVTYQVSANSGPTRSGTLTIAGRMLTVTQSGSGVPALNVSRSSLNFGYSAALVTSQQTITVTLSGSPAAWTVSSNQPNITVSPGSGSGNGTFQVTASPGLSGVLTVTAAGAVNSPQQIQVNIAAAAPGAPYGSFDTPVNNAAGIAGAIPVTGWALDSIDVAGVSIWREPVGAEPTNANGLVFIGDATFVPDARPDVESIYPNAPLNYRGGWGYMLLTNFLPNSGGGAGSGNGTYKLHALAVSAAGAATDLGTRTITVDNAHASKPFGTIDTPGQGGAVSGSAFVNFGWALAPNPNAIPTDGSTMTVMVDGVTLGHPVYNQYRSDIAALFPGLANSNGAVGFFYLDTTLLANGLHTISWVVADNAGHSDGIGSRYFTVLNSGAVAAPGEAGARSWRQHSPPQAGQARSMELEELGRMQLRLGASRGFLLIDGQRRPLPAGSILIDGVFYWQPGPGFLGKYQLLFESPGVETERVDVTIHPRFGQAGR